MSFPPPTITWTWPFPPWRSWRTREHTSSHGTSHNNIHIRTPFPQFSSAKIPCPLPNIFCWCQFLASQSQILFHGTTKWHQSKTLTIKNLGYDMPKLRIHRRLRQIPTLKTISQTQKLFSKLFRVSAISTRDYVNCFWRTAQIHGEWYGSFPFLAHPTPNTISQLR